MNWKHTLILGGMLLSTFSLQASTYYVATTGSDTTGNGSSALPFKTITNAVNRAVAGDLILVGPGTYQDGEQKTVPASGKSRVVITKNVTVRSTQGAQQTIIRGSKNSEALPYGANSVRCVYMTAGVLDGFTLLDGYADASSIPRNQRDSPVINGGGVYVPMGNRTPQINNCIITGCSAYRGGGAYWGTLNNCTVVNNRSNTSDNGGGVWSSAVNNSIVRFNQLDDFSLPASTVDTSVFKYCCLPAIPGVTTHGAVRDGGGNITDDPAFIAGTFIPARSSPCVNAGANIYASGERDAAGMARIVGGSVDIGAYEANFMTYQLTVINGSGSGIYTNGDVVAISTTNAVSEWMTFIGWAGDTNTVDNVLLSSTTLVMPASAITVTANYQTDPIDQIIGEVLGIPLPIATSNVTVFSVNPVVPSVALGPVADNDLAFVETVYTNAGTVVFSWNVSSEEGWDFLSFYVDDVLQTQISGEVSGVVTQFVAGVGPHKLKWEYSKDDWPDSWAGDDQGEVGPIMWIPDDLSTELGVPGPLAPPSFLQPGAPLPFPYGFQACFLDRNPPAGATSGLAVRLGGTNGVLPLVADNQATDAEVTLNGAGTLSFKWYTSCQTGDKLVCTVDGVEKASLTGDRSRPGLGWTNVVVEMFVPGRHVVRWSYVKDGSGKSAGDCGWIDNATWTRKPSTLTVLDGSGSGSYFIGDVVTIIGTNVTPSQVFEKWTGNVATVADVNSMTTTVFLLSEAVVVAANYKLRYDLTVTGGSGSGSYFGGQVIPVDATIPVGMVFDAWTGDTEYLADPSRPDTTLVMPERDIAIVALFKVAPYRVSLVNGWDAGSLPNPVHEGYGEPQGAYAPGAEVRIVANPAPLWKIFNGWTSIPAVAIADPNEEITSFTMPASNVALTANYRDQTESEQLSGALTIRGQPLVLSDYSTNGIAALSAGGIRFDDPVVKMGGPSVGRNQSVSLTTPSFTGDGILCFRWRGDSEAMYDGLSVEVDGTAISPVFSEKSTNVLISTAWNFRTYYISGANDITFRFSRDDSYIVHNNFVLLDRVIWIPMEIVTALDTIDIPNINQEFDPCFVGHARDKTGFHWFAGEDGGVRWDTAENAIKLGHFGYVTNNQLAQVAYVTDYYETSPAGGIQSWEWKTHSEGQYDRLEFMVDLIPTNWISGKNIGWTTNTFVLKKGYMRPASSPLSDAKWPIFGFRYAKDYDQSMVDDCGWMRRNTWLPTYSITMSGGTSQWLTFPHMDLVDLSLNGDVLSEAEKGVYPAGTLVSISAASPPLGMMFAGWVGDLGGVVSQYDPDQQFIMPYHNLSLTATYVDIPASPDPIASKPQIKSFSLTSSSAQPSKGLFTAMSLPSTSVGLTIVGTPGVNYDVEWSPSLSGPDCVWTVMPLTFAEIVGSTPEGYRILNIQVDAPSNTTQGFFRVKMKE
jgi:hypothetical protein